MKGHFQSYDKYYDLREPEPERRRARAERLRVVYALADHDGWDARRLGPLTTRALKVLYGVGETS